MLVTFYTLYIDINRSSGAENGNFSYRDLFNKNADEDIRCMELN